MIVHKAAHASEAGEQAPVLVADPFTPVIDRLALEEDGAAIREDWVTARNAEIKRVILQEARAPASSRAGLCERRGDEVQEYGRITPVGLLARRAT